MNIMNHYSRIIEDDLLLLYAATILSGHSNPNHNEFAKILKKKNPKIENAKVLHFPRLYELLLVLILQVVF